MPGIESEFVSYEYDTSLILTPENINRNATIVSATNPFKMRIQKKNHQRNVIYYWNHMVYKNHKGCSIILILVFYFLIMIWFLQENKKKTVCSFETEIF